MLLENIWGLAGSSGGNFGMASRKTELALGQDENACPLPGYDLRSSAKTRVEKELTALSAGQK